ncbi:hydroxymethylglutaryl-CoA reductase, degradative [Alkalihalobacillus sp. TS-13]|uniref:hydroxymethylglutaryl-CoA reductase, degradative n=1 Tax=Alkalihalobacillus sp. TS-13 TaxID=2842455 RepID=UPI001C87A5F3|nr:hydroxymethylglutaryl-CoA reductase, degradative [Alkalihalobacillus sp. TS-13]
MNSEISKFYQMELKERQEWMENQAGLLSAETLLFENFGSLGADLSDQLIENTVGVMEVPLGVAVNFKVNGKDVLVPMAVEESSVVAAASHGAKLARNTGGFKATTSESAMFSQIQLIGISDLYGAKMKILENKADLLELARKQDPTLDKLGGGPCDLVVRILDKGYHNMLVVHLVVNTLDAMGANAVNTMAESISPELERITGGKGLLKIVSNLADKRLARARCVIRKEDLIGEEVIDRIISAYHFAAQDPYRAATHNKGIMNGISSVILATGNDTRAVEAGAHAYAARFGQYTSLSTWEKDKNGNLVGTLELPMAVGIIGGATSIHPKAKANLKLMDVTKSIQLAEIIVSVGLAQNLTALKALATDGIQKGHMKLHAKNIAMMAGADGSQVDMIAGQLVKEGNVKLDRAQQILEQFYLKKRE